MSLNITTLTTSISGDLYKFYIDQIIQQNVSGENGKIENEDDIPEENKTNLKNTAYNIANAISENLIKHIQDNLEITIPEGAIKMALDDAVGRIIEEYVAGDGSNGGALTGASPIVGSIKSNKSDTGQNTNEYTIKGSEGNIS